MENLKLIPSEKSAVCYYVLFFYNYIRLTGKYNQCSVLLHIQFITFLLVRLFSVKESKKLTD